MSSDYPSGTQYRTPQDFADLRARKDRLDQSVSSPMRPTNMTVEVEGFDLNSGAILGVDCQGRKVEAVISDRSAGLAVPSSSSMEFVGNRIDRRMSCNIRPGSYVVLERFEQTNRGEVVSAAVRGQTSWVSVATPENVSEFERMRDHHRRSAKTLPGI